jgi:hypothetical protein
MNPLTQFKIFKKILALVAVPLTSRTSDAASNMRVVKGE